MIFGCGKQFGAKISYSEEPVALETAGGIIKALAMLAEYDNDVFMVINGDVYCDFDLQDMPVLQAEHNAHLMLVKNPEHNPTGDFQLNNGMLANPTTQRQLTYTFSGIALYRKAFFTAEYQSENEKRVQEHMLQQTVQPLAPMLRAAADQQKISASLLNAAWTDVGTPERLVKLNSI